MNARVIVPVLFAFLLSGSVYGAENTDNNAEQTPSRNADQSPAKNGDKATVKPWVHKLAFGILLHDVGFISTHSESGGVDPNWEIQFNGPEWNWWRWVGSPSPMTGATPNFDGRTSTFYMGLAWQFSLSNRFLDNLTNDFTKRLWLSPGVSAAAHTGDLHKNDAMCKQNDEDCGFGYRVIPRVQLELGINFWDNHAISLFMDHMSHKGLGHAQNQGIDHTGIRYHFTFNTPSIP